MGIKPDGVGMTPRPEAAWLVVAEPPAWEDEPLEEPDPVEDTTPEAAHAYRVQLEAERIRVREDARALVNEEKRPPAEPFDAGTLTEILARPQEPRARIDQIQPWEAATLLIAMRKIGKTTWLANLAQCLLTGEPFLGKFEVRPLDGDIAFLNYEVSGAQLARWVADVGVPPNRFFMVNVRGRRNPLADPEDRERLAAILTARGTETLIVDPFGRAFTGASQNDAGEVQSFLVSLDQFARAEVGARDLILSAHAGWNGERTRGSSALEDWADSLVTLTRDENDETGARYMRAIGRDVDLDEDRLSYEPETRRLTLAGAGSRKQANGQKRAAELQAAVLDIIVSQAGINGSEVEEKLRDLGVTFQRGDHRKALTALVDSGQIEFTTGARGAKCYSEKPDSPDSPQVAHGLGPHLAQPALYGRARWDGSSALPDSPKVEANTAPSEPAAPLLRRSSQAAELAVIADGPKCMECGGSDGIRPGSKYETDGLCRRHWPPTASQRKARQAS